MAVHVFLDSFIVVLPIGLMASYGGGREHLADRLVIAIAAVLGLLLAAGALAGGFHAAAPRARRARDRADPERYPG